MSTTIQVKNQTKKRLENLRKKYEVRFNRKLTYDEVIDLLVDNIEESFRRKIEAVNFLFGVISENKQDLIELRKEGEKRLEVISSNSR